MWITLQGPVASPVSPFPQGPSGLTEDGASCLSKTKSMSALRSAAWWAPQISWLGGILWPRAPPPVSPLSFYHNDCELHGFPHMRDAYLCNCMSMCSRFFKSGLDIMGPRHPRTPSLWAPADQQVARCPHSIESRSHDMRHNLCVAQGHQCQMFQLRPAREWSNPIGLNQCLRGSIGFGYKDYDVLSVRWYFDIKTCYI